MSAFLDSSYRAAPHWMQTALLSAYGLKLRRLRYRGVHSRVLRELLDSQWLSTDEHLSRQLMLLNAALEDARRTVPFYRTARWPRERLSSLDQLRELPILRKEDVRLAGRTLVSERYVHGPLTEIHTGGTSGKPLTVYCNAETVQRNYAFFERFRRWAGTPDGCRVATFAGRVLMEAHSNGPFWRRNWASNTMLFSSYHISPQHLPRYVDALAAWRPDMIDSYPSSVEPVARHLLATGDTRLRPKAVITSSETLFPEVRAVIEQAFGCRVFDHYGSAEMVALVTQCEHGSYHENPEFGILELLKDGIPVPPGEPGEVVATSLINPVMPLIRYAMGDWAIWDDKRCDCGRSMSVLREIGGRVDDAIVTPDSRVVGRIDPIFKAVSSLFECRVVQDGPDHLRLEIVSHGEIPSAEIAVLTSGLRDRVGPNMVIDVVRVSSIARTKGGKLRTVVNEWMKQKQAVAPPPSAD